MDENIANYVRPDRHMFESAEEEVSAFDELFKLQYNVEDENRVKKRVYWKDIIKREEQKAQEEQKMVAEEQEQARMKLEAKGDDGFEFKDADVKEISSVNPVNDFNKMVNDRNVDRVADALTQMQNMIERFVQNSLNGDLYEKAIECLVVLRETCVREDEGQAFNKFMQVLKSKFAKPGNNEDFFQEIVKRKISLITKKETSTSSHVTDEEAKKVNYIVFSFIYL